MGVQAFLDGRGRSLVLVVDLLASAFVLSWAPRKFREAGLLGGARRSGCPLRRRVWFSSGQQVGVCHESVRGSPGSSGTGEVLSGSKQWWFSQDFEPIVNTGCSHGTVGREGTLWGNRPSRLPLWFWNLLCQCILSLGRGRGLERSWSRSVCLEP